MYAQSAELVTLKPNDLEFTREGPAGVRIVLGSKLGPSSPCNALSGPGRTSTVIRLPLGEEPRQDFRPLDRFEGECIKRGLGPMYVSHP